MNKMTLKAPPGGWGQGGDAVTMETLLLCKLCKLWVWGARGGRGPGLSYLGFILMEMRELDSKKSEPSLRSNAVRPPPPHRPCHNSTR